MPSLRRILLLLASMVGAALVGWIAAAFMAPETRARASRQAEEDQQLNLLIFFSTMTTSTKQKGAFCWNAW
ncbi:hypothetical protein [Synechococcus sp. CC9605]|uniref:hypothetical protein n=1 Tax=Synechococcus sp. (strain CC9605) TaxID=110662 RepID=UPI0002EAA97F|nr:hypothetical protein [Synechococcus sp. CC9605]